MLLSFQENKKIALILIDVQEGFNDPVWGKRNNPDAEKNMALLLNKWREQKQPVFHIKNDSIEPASPLWPSRAGNAIKGVVAPLKNETVLIKHVNSAFIGTDLEKRLRNQNINTLVIAGLTTDHCVSTTARMADNLGFKVFVVDDATATFERKSYNGRKYTAGKMHALALASLYKEFAQIVRTEYFL